MDDLRQTVSSAYLADEDEIVQALLAKARITPAEAKATAVLARDLIVKVRASRPHAAGIDAFTQEYALQILKRVPGNANNTAQQTTLRFGGRYGLGG